MEKQDKTRMRQLYEQWQSSGLNMTSFVQQYKVSRSTMYYWMKKFRQEDIPASAPKVKEEKSFTQIQIEPAISKSYKDPLAILHFPSGISLELFNPVSPDFIKKLIS